MPYEHDAPVPPPGRSPAARWREPWRRWTPAAWIVYGAGMLAVILLRGRLGDGGMVVAWLVLLAAARPLSWVLWTRRRS